MRMIFFEKFMFLCGATTKVFHPALQVEKLFSTLGSFIYYVYSNVGGSRNVNSLISGFFHNKGHFEAEYF